MKKDVKSILIIAACLILSQLFKSVDIISYIFVGIACALMLAWIIGSIVWIKKEIK